MSDRLLRARQVAEAWNSNGGLIIRAEIDERLAEYSAEIDRLMCDPDKLTGKNAIAKANRRRSLLDLKEFVKDAMRPLDAM